MDNVSSYKMEVSFISIEMALELSVATLLLVPEMLLLSLLLFVPEALAAEESFCEPKLLFPAALPVMPEEGRLPEAPLTAELPLLPEAVLLPEVLLPPEAVLLPEVLLPLEAVLLPEVPLLPDKEGGAVALLFPWNSV